MTQRGQRVCVPITIPSQTKQTYAVLEFLGLTSQNSPAASRPTSSCSPESLNVQDSMHPFRIVPDQLLVAQAFKKKKSSRLNHKANGLMRGKEKKNASQMMSPRKSMSLSLKEFNPAGSEVEQMMKYHHIAATTFVQADSSSFRELVQKFTGAGETSDQDKLPVNFPTKPAARKVGLIGNGAVIRHGEAGAWEPKQVLGSSAKLREERQASKGLNIRRSTDYFKRKEISSVLQRISFQNIQGQRPSNPTDTSLSDHHVFEAIDIPLCSSEQVWDKGGINSGPADQNFPILKECSFLHPQVERHADSDLRLLPLFPFHS
ncbi:hypothetical protein O6H91_01G015200 [Diphasiastrum complanatum]|uniref:Uncharacterized protein n=1 Tax=Diphasiastrum complanatum TaxID=34168 RepID=A0ACC2END9_DIPCM|nr:hypothetical protein O6H91_01G015200 [Diphasiastrum complanatum]